MIDNFYIEPPFKCNYDCNTEIGKFFYANCEGVIIDVNKVIVRNNVEISPRTEIYTELSSRCRDSQLEKTIIIGNNV